MNQPQGQWEYKESLTNAQPIGAVMQTPVTPVEVVTPVASAPKKKTTKKKAKTKPKKKAKAKPKKKAKAKPKKKKIVKKKKAKKKR